MSTPEFEITISPDGKVTVIVRGAGGQRCLELSDMLREIVGREESRQLTPEYYQPEGTVRFDASVRQRTGGRPGNDRD